MRQLFRGVALLEAVTYLVLLGAVVAFRVFDGPDATAGIGPVHGVVFLVYAALVLLLRAGEGWSTTTTAVLLAAAIVPLGGLWAERRVVAR